MYIIKCVCTSYYLFIAFKKCCSDSLHCKLSYCERTCCSVQAYEKYLCRWHLYDGETSMCDDDEGANYDRLQENRHFSSETCAGSSYKSCTSNVNSSQDAFVDTMILLCLKLRNKSNQSCMFQL